MDLYDRVDAKINRLSKWQAVAFSAVCVERIAPICLQLGRERTWTIFKNGLDFVWAAIRKEQTEQEMTRISHALKATPEACIDDSRLPEFYVIKALIILDTALESTCSPDWRESTKSLSSQIEYLMADFSQFLEQAHVSFTNHKNSRNNSTSLETQEPKIQREILEELLLQTEPSADIITRLQIEARHQSKIIENVIPHIVTTKNRQRQSKGELPEIYEELMQSIDMASKWQIIGFCATCVERLVPVFYQLPSEQFRELFEWGTKLLWAASFGEMKSSEAIEIQQQIYARPTGMLDDMELPEMYIWNILHILADALEVLNSPTGKKAAKFVCSAVCDLMAEFDFFLNQRADQTETGHAPATAFLIRESLAQQEVLNMIRSQEEPSSELIHHLREQVQEFSKHLEKQLPHLFEVMEEEDE